MIQSLYTGISGLLTQQAGLDTTSNNLANMDTTGFKGNSIEFKSLFGVALSSASASPVDSTVGMGASLQATPTILKAGEILLTDSPTDLAISGDGWFGVKSNGETMYTQNGSFGFDANRDLVNAKGQYVLGTSANNFSNGVLTSTSTNTDLGSVGSQTPLILPNILTYPAQATTTASFQGNIGIDNTTQTLNATILDAQGDKNLLTLSFTQTVPQPATGISWDVTATAKSPAALDGSSTTYDTQTGVVTFDTSGGLLSSTLSSINNNASPVSINLGTGFTGLISNSSATSSSNQTDGVASGNLTGYSVNPDGNVIATFTNGRQVSMAKLALYHFQNDQGLNSLDGVNFTQSANSGAPMFFQDSTGKNILGATLMSSSLESSNVDPTAGLTDLIVYQRAYDANSKLITTSDQMIQKALQMST